MPIQEVKSPHCQIAMAEGFALDHGHGVAYSGVWVEGKPERYWLGGVKVKGRATYAIRVFRCPKCGYLVSFANEPAKPW